MVGRGGGYGWSDLRSPGPVICNTDYTCYQDLAPSVLVYSSSKVGSKSG